MTKEIKKKLRFNNRDIHNHISNFVSSTGKNKDRVYTSFKMTQTTQLKGLNLCEYKKGEKHFVIQFYMKGQRTLRRFTLGKFNNNLNVVTGETKFGVKQCQERMFKIIKEHCDEYGHWIKDPNLTVAYTQVNQSITIRDLIKEYCKAGFEKMRTAEKMTANSIRDKARYLIGYNIRVKHLEYDNEENGDGVVIFKPCKTLRLKSGGTKSINRPAPKDWDELFKWYPPGRSILTDHNFNLHGITSMYDDKIGKVFIEDLRIKLILGYVNQYNAYSTKKCC